MAETLHSLFHLDLTAHQANHITKFESMSLKIYLIDRIGTVVSEKIQFEFFYVHYLGSRSRNNIDLQYSHIFIYSIRCLLLLPFRLLTAIVSERSTVVTFSYRKA